MTSTGLTTLIQATHVLHVRHALSGGPVPSLGATLVPPTPWWYGGKLTPAGDLAVVAADHFPDTAADPVVLLSVADPGTAATLAKPLVEVTLSQPEQTHTFASVNQTVTLVLVDKQGKPKTGLTNVRAFPGSAAAVAMAEVASQPGTYRSAPRAWTTAQLKFEIKNANSTVAIYRLNPFALDTRVHGVVA